MNSYIIIKMIQLLQSNYRGTYQLKFTFMNFIDLFMDYFDLIMNSYDNCYELV